VAIRSMLAIIFSLVCLGTAYGQEQGGEGAKPWMDVVQPGENAEIISKKPRIKVNFKESVDPKTVLVLLDTTDVTQLASFTEKGFEFQPLLVLPSGEHTLTVSATDKEGRKLQHQVKFKTRHTALFEEASTKNDAFISYESAVHKPGEDPNANSKFDGNLKSDTLVKNKEWQVTFNTNIRYQDQNTDLQDPLNKGLDVANYLLTGTYQKDKSMIKASLGDVQITETPLTISGLSRRGGLLNLHYDIFQLDAFSVRSDQLIGLRGSSVTGVDTTTDSHIVGLAGGAKLFDKQVELKTVYSSGEDLGTSAGISNVSPVSKGDVWGFFLTSDFFQKKAVTEMEAGFSRFSPDINDSVPTTSDRAYRVRMGGAIDKYTYAAQYQYTGRDYQVVGNPFLQRDREEVNLTGSGRFGFHNLSTVLLRRNDNVRDSEVFPILIDYQGNLAYAYTRFPTLPMNLTYMKDIQYNTKRPTGTAPIKLYTDTVTGAVNHTRDKWNFGFQTSLSLKDDKTPDNGDTTTITYSLTSAYAGQKITVAPAFSLNQSKVHQTGVRTDTYITNLDVRTKWLRDLVTFDFGGTYSIIQTTDDSAENWNLNGHARLGYSLREFFKGSMDPVVALKGVYNKITDRVDRGVNKDEYTIFLVLSLAMPFSF
jgi:hypothetical protein